MKQEAERQRVALSPKQEEEKKQAEERAKCNGIMVTVGQSERLCFKPGAGKSEQFKDCSTCPEMVVVPAGSFTMGSPANEPERGSSEEQVRVSIPAPFAVGRFAITRGEYATFVLETNHPIGDTCFHVDSGNVN